MRKFRVLIHRGSKFSPTLSEAYWPAINEGDLIFRDLQIAQFIMKKAWLSCWFHLYIKKDWKVVEIQDAETRQAKA